MKYIGLQTQIRQNNFKSTVLLILFPCVVIGLTWSFFFLLFAFGNRQQNESLSYYIPHINILFIQALPWVIGGVSIWMLIAYFSHSAMIRSATASSLLERKDNKRVYNLVENLCMANGMQMPKVNVIEDDSLNAFASGINKRTYTVTLSRGIINKLNDEELESVIAHELTHIRNHDVRLLIVSIVFVGVFAFLSQMLLRMLFYAPRRSGNNKKDNGAVLILIGLAIAVVGYLISILLRFGISRKREYLADAGSAEMTKNPLALASALRKISNDPLIEAVERDDVAQLFIEHPSGKKAGLFSAFAGLFATHPPIKDRIRVLEQF